MERNYGSTAPDWLAERVAPETIRDPRLENARNNCQDSSTLNQYGHLTAVFYGDPVFFRLIGNAFGQVAPLDRFAAVDGVKTPDRLVGHIAPAGGAAVGGHIAVQGDDRVKLGSALAVMGIDQLAAGGEVGHMLIGFASGPDLVAAFLQLIVKCQNVAWIEFFFQNVCQASPLSVPPWPASVQKIAITASFSNPWFAMASGGSNVI